MRRRSLRHQVTARDAWSAYVTERTPHWGERHRLDHDIKAAPGGDMGKRGKKLHPGPLAPLLALPLRELDTATIEAWAAKETQTLPTVVRLAWRLLKSFLGWCAEQPAYAGVVPAEWKGLTIPDKVEGERVIPLTP